MVQTLIGKRQPNLNVSLFAFSYQTVFILAALIKNVKKLLRNSEYSKSKEVKKLSVLRLDLSFL